MSVAHSFLGIQLQCAECHKHPFDQWTQNDFVDFSSFFDTPILKRGRKGRSSKASATTEKELSLLRSHTVKVGDSDPREPIMDWLRKEDNPGSPGLLLIVSGPDILTSGLLNQLTSSPHPIRPATPSCSTG